MILSVLEAVLAPIFPSYCHGCAKPLTAYSDKVCQGCKLTLNEHVFSWENTWHPSPIAGVRSAWSAMPYRGPVKQALQRVKFQHEFYLLDWLSKPAMKLFDAITAETAYDAIIPMPIDFPGRWNRRYNQTEILASLLCKSKGLKTDLGILFKRWGFRPQHGLKKEERKWNLFGAFGIRTPRTIKGKTFLLVDDIITTGATASEAARLLLKHGAQQVDLFTLARSEKQALR